MSGYLCIVFLLSNIYSIPFTHFKSVGSFGEKFTVRYKVKTGNFCRYLRHRAVFWITRDTLLVLSGWCNVSPCLVLSRLALSCIMQDKSLPYKRMTVDNTGCNWFAQCSWEVYVQTVKMIFMFIEKLWYVENFQKPTHSKTRQDWARQNDEATDKQVSLGFEEYRSIQYVPSFKDKHFPNARHIVSRE